MTEEKPAPPSVGALRMLMVLQRLKRRDFLQSFDLDGRCDSERLMNALTFMFLTEFDSPEYGKALQKLIPIINYELTDGKMASADMKQSRASSSKLDQKIKGAYNAWQMLMFAVCHSAGIDHDVWDPRPFIREGGFDDNGRIGAMFDYERVNDREALLLPVMKPLRQTIDKRIAALRRHDRVSLKAVQELQSPLMLRILLDDAARGRVNTLWHDAKRIHALFFRHTNITQPVLLAAMMYCGFTKNGVKSSLDLRDKSESMHELFYLVMDLAVPRSEYNHEYHQYQRGAVDHYDASMRSKYGTKRNDEAVRNDMVALKDVLSTFSNTNHPQNNKKRQSSQPQYTFKASQRALSSEKTKLHQNGERNDDPRSLPAPQQPPATISNPPPCLEVTLGEVKLEDRYKGYLEIEELYMPAIEPSPQCNIWRPVQSDCGFHICCHRSMFVEIQPLENCAIWPYMSGLMKQREPWCIDRVLGIGVVRILVKEATTGRGIWATLSRVLYIPSATMNQLIVDEKTRKLNFEEYHSSSEGLFLGYAEDKNRDLKLTPEPDGEYVPLRVINEDFNIADYQAEIYDQVPNTSFPAEQEFENTYKLSSGKLVRMDTQVDHLGRVSTTRLQQVTFLYSG